MGRTRVVCSIQDFSWNSLAFLGYKDFCLWRGRLLSVCLLSAFRRIRWLYTDCKWAKRGSRKRRWWSGQKRKKARRRWQCRKIHRKTAHLSKALLLQHYEKWNLSGCMSMMRRRACIWSTCSCRSRCSCWPKGSDGPFSKCIGCTDCSDGIYLACSWGTSGTFWRHLALWSLLIVLALYLFDFAVAMRGCLEAVCSPLPRGVCIEHQL